MSILKIIGEKTRPTDGAPLCNTCRYAGRVRGTRFSDDFIRCQVMGRVTFHVTECSSYNDARLVPLHELYETAWTWYSDRFVSPKELLRLQEQAEKASESSAQG